MGSYRLVKMLNPISITVNGTFTPKGAYNAGTSYSVGDQVDYNGTSYILYSAASAGTLPTDNTKWGVLASKGDTGTTGSPGTNGTNGTNGLPGADGYTPIKGVDYFDGATGAPGSPGSNGTNGTNGQGVPTGGTTGQQLAKINGTDYNTQWVNPVDISGKQDTLVSGTSIKTINSTSLLGSGDIVVAAGSDPLKEDVANKSTTTTLGTSDTLYPSQKAVKTYVDTTTGAYVSKAGDTMTGTLNTQTLLPTANLTYNLGGTSNYNLNTYTQKLYLNSTAYFDGGTAGQALLSGSLYIQSPSSSGYLAIDSASGNGTSTLEIMSRGASHGGDALSFQMRTDVANAIAYVYDTSTGNFHDFFRFDYLNDIVRMPHVNPLADSTWDMGSSSRYWRNTYTDRLYLNSTASLDGSTAGQINLTGNLALSGADTTVSLTGVTTEPSAPSTGQLKIYSKKIAGKMFPKTVGPSGIDSPLQNAFWQNNICIWQPTTASNGLWLGTAPASAGTYATVLPTSTSLYTAMKRGRWSNIATTANQVLTQRSLELMYFLGNSAGMGGFFFYTRMGFDTWTDGGRLFAGLFNGNSLIQSDPSTVNNNIGFAVDVADNGLIYFQTKGTGAAVRTSTGFTITSGSGYDMYIFAAPNSTTVSWRILEINTGTEATGSSAVSGPAVNVMMMAGIQASNAALTSVNAIQLCINRIYVETDR